MHGSLNGSSQKPPNYGTYGGDAASSISSDNTLPKMRKERQAVYVEVLDTFRGLRERLQMFGNQIGLNVAAFVLLPWALFTVVMLPFALAWRRFAALCWTIWLFSALGSIFLMWISTRHKPYGRPPLYWKSLGGLCLFATVLAAPVGIYDYDKYTKVFYFYEESPAYSNVLATEDPGAFQDAGSITFSGDALVDWRFANGYKAGRVYCLAPIISLAAREQQLANQTNTSDREVANFFAVGYDCCPTGHFTCGPVDVRTVRGGLRVMDVSSLEFPVVPKFLIAAKQVGSTYGLDVPDDAIFVEWHRDPEHDQTSYWDDAIEFYLNAVLTYLLTVVGVGILGVFVYDTYRRTMEAQSGLGHALK